MNRIFWALIFSFGFLVSQKSFSAPLKALELLPVQDQGRIKPYDTFARESLELVYGKQNYQGKPATEIIMTWLLDPVSWQERKIVEIKHHLVKEGLKLDVLEKYFSVQEILSNDRISLLMQQLNQKREEKAKLDPYFQALQRLEQQIYVLRSLANGSLLRLVPPAPSENPGDSMSQTWKSVAEFSESEHKLFSEVTGVFLKYLSLQVSTTKKDPSEIKQLTQDVFTKVGAFSEYAKKQNPGLYPAATDIELEVHYNQFHPFRWAYIAYLLAFLAVVLSWIFKRSLFYQAAWVVSLVGFLMHIYGFCLRVYLTGRPPVSNMYETVVWVGFGAMVFSMIIELTYKWRFILMAGTAVAAFCLIVADTAPIILDPSLTPLEPVLRSNFWLMTHVLTITISYAAFFLAMACADIGLYFFIKDPQKYQPQIKAIVLSVYRAMQIGVGLLAPGIILGGIWADYSWGRFWGWDPKETWALIALLGYVAVLHGRVAGLLKDFGILVSGILTFSLVIMAWYGVNFILGAGLHSYGFGAGGVEYVASFVAIHILYVCYASVLYRDRKRSIQ